MIAIVDYGMGNLRSVQKAFEFLGHTAKITDRATDLKDAKRIVLPGVGAFNDAIDALKKKRRGKSNEGRDKKGQAFFGDMSGYANAF